MAWPKGKPRPGAIYTCTIPGCDKPHNARGYCWKHYERWKKFGDPLKTEIIRGDPVSRFWSKVDTSRECWIWTGPVFNTGPGQFYCDGKNWIAYRWLWERERGPIPTGKFLCHTCDNSLCVRLEHLYVGNHRTNMDDRVERKTGGRGERHGVYRGSAISRLSDEDIDAIKRSSKSQTALARQYGISQSTVSRIKHSAHWRQSPS